MALPLSQTWTGDNNNKTTQGGVLSPAPPLPRLGALREQEGEGDRRYGKVDGDGRRDGSLGPWLGSPLVPLEFLRESLGPPEAPGGPPGAPRGARGPPGGPPWGQVGPGGPQREEL